MVTDDRQFGALIAPSCLERAPQKPRLHHRVPVIDSVRRALICGGVRP
jgi:hypothetical protein